MASLGLWKARMLLVEQRRNPDANRSVFTMQPFPKTNTKQKPRKRHAKAQRDSGVNRQQTLSSSKTQNDERSQKEQRQSDKVKPPAEPKDAAVTTPSGEGITSEEKLVRQRVYHHEKPVQGNDHWGILFEKDEDRYERSVNDEKAARIVRQREYGHALRMQIEENAQRLVFEKRRQQSEAEQMIKEVKEKEKEEKVKQQMQTEVVAKNRQFIQDQMRIRQAAAEKAEQTRQRLDLLAIEPLQKQLEKEEQLAETARRRIREDLRRNRAQNEKQMKEKARVLAEERQRHVSSIVIGS